MSQSNLNGWFLASPSSSPSYSGLYIQSNADSDPMQLKVPTLMPSFHFPNIPLGIAPVTSSPNSRPPDEIGNPGPPIITSDEVKGPPGANLFVFHLPNELSNWDLYLLFRRYGTILSVHTMVDKASGLSRGFGFVSYSSQAEAMEAIAHLDGLKLGKKRLKVQQKRESLSDDYTPLDPQSRSYCSIEEALKKSLRSSKNSDDVPANPSEISTDSVVRDCDSAVTTPKNPLRRPIKLALPGVTPSSSPFIESEHSVKLLEDVNKGASEEQGDYFSASLESPTPRSVVVSKSPSLNRIDSDFDEVEDEDHVCSCKYCGQDFKR